MSLIVRLGCVGALTAGGFVPVALGAFSGERDKWGEFVFTSAGGGISRSPILTCSREDSSIQVFLAQKNVGKAEDNQEIYLKGEGIFEDKRVNFEEKDSLGKLWNLKVFGSSGTTWLLPILDAHGIVEQLDCKVKNVFSVKKQADTSDPDWERPISDVQLVLNGCKEVKGVTECDISIKTDGNKNLEWNPKFQPKAFFK